MKTSIALIGFMGTGKTAVGKILAEKSGKEFVELDALIEKKAGKSIPSIFRDEGEIAFRELEIAVTREVSSRKNAVIACGGGIVLNKINIDRLKQECVIVCLAASPEVILKRTSTDKEGRPLLAVADRARQVKEMEGMGLNELSHVEQFPQEPRRRWNLYSQNRITCLYRSQLMAYRTDSADTLSNNRHLFKGPPHAKPFISSKLGHMELGIIDFTVAIELNRNLPMPLQAAYGIYRYFPHRIHRVISSIKVHHFCGEYRYPPCQNLC